MGDLNLSRETKSGQAPLSTSPLYADTKIKRLAVMGTREMGRKNLSGKEDKMRFVNKQKSHQLWKAEKGMNQSKIL